MGGFESLLEDERTALKPLFFCFVFFPLKKDKERNLKSLHAGRTRKLWKLKDEAIDSGCNVGAEAFRRTFQKKLVNVCSPVQGKMFFNMYSQSVSKGVV